MNAIATRTVTYTAVDIRKVVDSFAADFSMKAQSTGLRSRESVANVVSDLKIFAEHEYLTEVQLMLKDSSGEVLRATVYEVSTQAVGWTNDRPGNNLWPKMSGGSLYVLASLNQAWWNKSDDEKEAFIRRHNLHSSWSPSTDTPSLLHLTSASGQRYASNGYGWQRTDLG